MAQQANGEGPAGAAAGAGLGNQPAANGLPAPLAQLVEVLKADCHNPLTVCPQKLLTMVFEANIAQHEQAEIDRVKPSVQRAVEALVVAATSKSFPKKVWSALRHSLAALDVQLPDMLEDAPEAVAANSAATKKSEYHLLALQATAVIGAKFNSLGSLRLVADKLALAKRYGIAPPSVAAFAKLHWQTWKHDTRKSATLLETIMEGLRGEKQLDEGTLLTLSWSALAEFLEEVQPDDVQGDTAAAFMLSVEREVIHPLTAVGCSPAEVMQVLEAQVLGPLANRLFEEADTGALGGMNLWTEARLTLRLDTITARVLERRRIAGHSLPNGGKVLPASILHALNKAVEVLVGGTLPSGWRSGCAAAGACPLHALVPELCPYGDAGCPGIHLPEEQRQDLVADAFGDRNPLVINLWGRATRAGELARHKLSRPGTYTLPEQPVQPPLTSGGKKGRT